MGRGREGGGKKLKEGPGLKCGGRDDYIHKSGREEGKRKGTGLKCGGRN